MFAKLVHQFDKSYKRRAYLHNYTELDIFKDLSEFDESRLVNWGGVMCRTVVGDIIDEYRRAESVNYISE